MGRLKNIRIVPTGAVTCGVVGGGGGREMDVTLWANLRTLNRNSIGIVPTGSVTCVGGITIRVILQLLYNNSKRISNAVGGALC